MAPKVGEHTLVARDRTVRFATNVTVIDVANRMSQLARNRPVLHSDADFQHAFA